MSGPTGAPIENIIQQIELSHDRWFHLTPRVLRKSRPQRN